MQSNPNTPSIFVHRYIGDEIFTNGIQILKSNNHSSLYIHAPTGAWLKDPLKEQWFWTIAVCLTNARTGQEKTKLTERLVKLANQRQLFGSDVSEEDIRSIYWTYRRLEQFIGVYGLPPTTSLFGKNPRLEYLGNLLSYFKHIPTAKLSFLPVDTTSIPALGHIILDGQTVFIGFSTAETYKVDKGVLINDMSPSNGIAKDCNDWFKFQILDRLSSKYIIQDLQSPSKITFESGISSAKRETTKIYFRRRYEKLLTPIVIIQSWIMFVLLRLTSQPQPQALAIELLIVMLFSLSLVISIIRGLTFLFGFFAIILLLLMCIVFLNSRGLDSLMGFIGILIGVAGLLITIKQGKK